MRRILIATAFSAIAATAVAAPFMAARIAPAAQAATQASPTAEAFATSLVNAINTTLASNATVTDLVALQTSLEQAIEATFLASNVSPEAALAGVDQAAKTLTSTNVMCALPDGPATKRCEAVALAFVLAHSAAEAAQTEPTGSIGGNAGSALGAPPSTGSGGGGGGVTHPPVTN